MTSMTSNPISRTCRGFTLVELLVAVVILSIGLLGVARLSLGSVQSNGSAFMRSTATELVQEIVAEMRANQPQAVSLGYNIALGANPGAAPNCVTAACSAAQVATYDLANWTGRLAALLPSGKGQVSVAPSVNPTTGSTEYTATVSVQWNDSVAQLAFANNNAAPATVMSITMETLL
jgi:type IV pilus assembly protein PilV